MFLSNVISISVFFGGMCVGMETGASVTLLAEDTFRLKKTLKKKDSETDNFLACCRGQGQQAERSKLTAHP